MSEAEIFEQVVKILTPYVKDEGALANIANETNILEDLKVNWFSDGGISSNFPIHLFDSWLPPYPASLAWAILWIVGWFAVLAGMARRGIVLKV